MPQAAKLGRWEPHEAHQRKIQSPHLRSKNLMLQHIFRPPQMESHRKAPWHHGGHHVKHLPAIKPHVKKNPNPLGLHWEKCYQQVEGGCFY